MNQPVQRLPPGWWLQAEGARGNAAARITIIGPNGRSATLTTPSIGSETIGDLADAITRVRAERGLGAHEVRMPRA